MREFYINCSDSVRLHCCSWHPDGEPIAIVQIIHGVAEHIERYNDFASFLASHGILVAGEDHPGHGKTQTSEHTLGYMSGGWDGALDGIHMLRQEIGRLYPETPYFMLGHSMGSFLLRTYLFDKRCKISGAILSGTGWQPSLLLKMGQLVCRMETARLGDAGRSKILQSLIFDMYNKKFAPNRTPYDWLSTDESVADQYANDDLCGFSPTVQLCREMFGGMSRIQNINNIHSMDPSIPILFVAGKDDPVGDMGKGVLRTVRKFQQVMMHDLEVAIYPGMRHEILNEIDKKMVYNDILHWIFARN